MQNQILDEGYSNKHIIRNNGDIKALLKSIGLTTFYEHKNGSIIVEEGDAVRIEIGLDYDRGKVNITQRFPVIGNTVQIISTFVLLVVSLFIPFFPFPLPWIVAVVGGQLISYLLYKPRTTKLKERIEKYL